MVGRVARRRTRDSSAFCSSATAHRPGTHLLVLLQRGLRRYGWAAKKMPSFAGERGGQVVTPHTHLPCIHPGVPSKGSAGHGEQCRARCSAAAQHCPGALHSHITPSASCCSVMNERLADIDASGCMKAALLLSILLVFKIWLSEGKPGARHCRRPCTAVSGTDV